MTNVTTATTAMTQKTYPAREASTAITVAALLVSATQLAGCLLGAGPARRHGRGPRHADRRPTGTQAIDRGLQLEIDNTLDAKYSGRGPRDAAVFN